MSRKEKRADLDALMVEQDREVIGIVNANFVCSEATRRADDAVLASRVQAKERQATRTSRKTAREDRNMVNVWLLCCTVILCLASWFLVPAYAVVFIPASSVALMIHLCRFQKPIEVLEGVA